MASGTLDGDALRRRRGLLPGPRAFVRLGRRCPPVPTRSSGRGVEIPVLQPVVTLIPSSKRYPARGGHDQFYGWGRVNVSRGVNAILPRPFGDANVKATMPPEVEITSPEWFDQVDPDAGDAAVEGEVYARGEPYTCQVLVAPGHYPNNGSTEDTPPATSSRSPPITATAQSGPTRSTAPSPSSTSRHSRRCSRRRRGRSTAASPATAPADLGRSAEHRPVRLHRQGRRHRRGPARADGRGSPRALSAPRPGHARRVPAEARAPTVSRRPPLPTWTATIATS